MVAPKGAFLMTRPALDLSSGSSPGSAGASTAPLAVPAEADLRDLYEALKVRRSIRTYDGSPLRPEHRAFIERYLHDEAHMTGPFGRRFRIALLQGLPKDMQVGTYGYTKGFDAILAAIAKDDAIDLFELAFVAHGLVLELTHLGLGTVWMGAAFSQGSVRRNLTFDEGEQVAAIIPLGYPAEKKRVLDFVLKKGLKPSERKPMDFSYFVGSFEQPLGDTPTDLRDALDLARFAPSAMNKQSWRAVLSDDGDRVHLYAKFSLRHKIGMGFRQYAVPPEYLDVGTWARSFDVATRATGLEGRFHIADPGIALPDGEDIEYLCTWTRS